MSRTDVQNGIAFDALARQQMPRLRSLARRLVAAEAEDLMQDCLLRAHRSFPCLRDDAAASAWLTSILLNCAKDRYRAAARHPEEPVDPVGELSLFCQIAAAAADPFLYPEALHVDFLCCFDAEDVWQVLAQLPQLYRVPLVLVHMEGRPVKQTATLLEVPVGTLLSRLHRGRKLFERELWDYATRHDLLSGRPR